MAAILTDSRQQVAKSALFFGPHAYFHYLCGVEMISDDE